MPTPVHVSPSEKGQPVARRGSGGERIAEQAGQRGTPIVLRGTGTPVVFTRRFWFLAGYGASTAGFGGETRTGLTSTSDDALDPHPDP